MQLPGRCSTADVLLMMGGEEILKLTEIIDSVAQQAHWQNGVHRSVLCPAFFERGSWLFSIVAVLFNDMLSVQGENTCREMTINIK